MDTIPDYGFASLNSLAREIHWANVNKGWWNAAPGSGRTQDDINVLCTKIALIHSEASEMLEGLRKGIRDDHLTHRSMEEVECADLLIRIFDYAGARNFNLADAVREKLQYNEHREDHKPENRAADGGKKV